MSRRGVSRSDEARIGYAPDDAYAADLTDRLVRRGYEIVEIVPVLVAGRFSTTCAATP